MADPKIASVTKQIASEHARLEAKLSKFRKKAKEVADAKAKYRKKKPDSPEEKKKFIELQVRDKALQKGIADEAAPFAKSMSSIVKDARPKDRAEQGEWDKKLSPALNQMVGKGLPISDDLLLNGDYNPKTGDLRFLLSVKIAF